MLWYLDSIILPWWMLWIEFIFPILFISSKNRRYFWSLLSIYRNLVSASVCVCVLFILVNTLTRLDMHHKKKQIIIIILSHD